MPLRIFNTLTRRIEEFAPREPGKTGIYTCGPTVYRYVHIGNLRTFLMADWLRRSLEAQGFEVTHVKNITDVGHMRQEMLERGEDKIIAAALAEGKSPAQIAQFYTETFIRDEAALNILPAHIFPRASDHVPEMIDLTATLLERGCAYERQGNVYFDVEKFPEYGKLSGQRGEGLAEGVRAEADPLKKSQHDFALWKAAEPGRLLKWSSPWGEGFPGWHIECSAMATKYLGQPLDIHSGGVDNIFPHHEDEIAQSEAASQTSFVRYWLHGQHLLVDGLKMAKSTGNSYTVEDIQRRGFEPLAFRYLCATIHYRARMNFTWQALRGAQHALLRLREKVKAPDGAVSAYTPKEADAWRERFWQAINDDLNLPRALAIAWQLARSDAPSALVRDLLLEFDRIFGFDLARTQEALSLPADLQTAVRNREEMRKDRNYAAADAVRGRIVDRGYEVRDRPDGSSLVLSRPAWRETTNFISASRDVESLIDQPDSFDFTVSIISRDNRPELERALGSCLSWSDGHDVEIIVVDNGSSEGSIEHLPKASENQRLCLIQTDHNLGMAAARNITLKQARGHFVIMLDTSVEIMGDIFTFLKERLSDPQIGIVGRWGVCSDDLRNFVEVDRPGEVDAIEGYVIAFRRELLRETGLLDEKFRFYRHLDLDLSLAIRSRGYRLIVDHRLPVVRHEHGDWLRTPPEERERLSKRNFYRFLHKWGHRTDLLVGT